MTCSPLRPPRGLHRQNESIGFSVCSVGSLPSLPVRRRSPTRVARTALFGCLIAERGTAEVDVVVNLAAGLGTRPYRMALGAAMRARTPSAGFGRLRGEAGAFQATGGHAHNAMLLSEGLLFFPVPEEIAAFVRDHGAAPAFRHWTCDPVSPDPRNMLQRRHHGA